MYATRLEPELGEEPPVGSSGVSLLEVLLDGLLGVLPLSGLLESLGRDGSLQALELESVSGGEQVGVVDSLDERLDLRSPGNSLSTHRLGDLQGVLLDSGNNGVRVRPVLGTLVDLLDDDDLLSSLSSRKDDGDLAGLVDCR